MVVVGALVTDADDTESFRIPRLCFVVHTPLELNFHLYVDVLPVKIFSHVLDLLPPPAEWRGRAIPTVQPLSPG
jgi:hypothetical protein